MLKLSLGLALLAQVPAGHVLAQVVPDPYGILLQYGLAGILGVMLLRRYDGELSRERSARERSDAQLDALTEKVMGDIVPLVAEVQRTMVPTLDRVAAEVTRMAHLIDQLHRLVTTRNHREG